MKDLDMGILSAMVLATLVFSLVGVIDQKPVDYSPCEKHGMKEAKVVLIDNKMRTVSFQCGGE